MERLLVREIMPTDLTMLTGWVGQLETYVDAIPRIASKLHQRVFVCAAVPSHAALLIKQELLALDGDALISTDVYLGQSNQPTPMLAWASDRAWRACCQKLRHIPVDGCQAFVDGVHAALDPQRPKSLTVAHRTWVWGERTLVMGIINITPDSFSQDGLLDDHTYQSVVDQALAFAGAGVDILDIGGESTRPGASAVTAEEEIARVVPAITAIREACDLPISIDTYKAEVAEQALAAGANLVNDVWGLRTPSGEWNKAMAKLVARHQTPLILMHNRRARAAQSSIGGHFTDTRYGDMLHDICWELHESIMVAEELGLDRQYIIVDPGLGFGKNPDQNIELLQRLHELKVLGQPILVGTSRKSFIGLALNAAVDQRVYGTAATLALAIAQGADIVRVHDVKAGVDVCAMSDALIRPGAWKRRTT